MNNNGVLDSGEEVAFDGVSDFSVSIADRGINRTVPPGTYWARVYTASDNQNTGYTFTASATDFPTTTPADPGASLVTALNLGILGATQTFSDAVGSLDRSDIYRFELNQDGQVTLNLSGLTEAAQLSLIADTNNNGILDAGEEIAFDGVSDFSVSTADRGITRALTQGTYWARVYTASNNQNTGYSLTLLAPGNIIGNTISITATDTDKLEGNGGNTAFTFTLTRSGNNLGTPSSVDYAVTGNGIAPADGSDFGGTLPTGTVNFAANQTTATLTINVSGDVTIEPGEGFRVTLSNPTNGTIALASTTGTIRDDDTTPVTPPVTPPTTSTLDIGILDADQPEGNSGTTPFTFTITRSGDTSGTSSARYVVLGGSVNPVNANDFGGTFPTGTVDFAAGQTTATVTIDITGDTDPEPDELFTVVLVDPINATIAATTATAIIRDDDSVATPPPVTPPITPPVTPPSTALLSVSNTNIFSLNSTNPVTLDLSLTQTNTQNVNEIGIIRVEDAQGRINGLAPSDPGYLDAALANSQVVFSALANRPNGFSGNSQRLLTFAPSELFRVYLVQNGSTDQVLTGAIGRDRISFSSVQIVSQGNDAFTLNWEDGTGAVDFRDVVLQVKPSSQTGPIGTGLQGSPQAEVFDLRQFQGQQIQAEFSIYREAAFDNFVGFYQINDGQGTVTDPLTGGTFAPGEAGYTQAALRARVPGVDLTTANQTTTVFTDRFGGGTILAPFIIANGSPDQLLDDNPGNDPAIYFPFLGANSDGVDHIRLLADNTFGFEDIAGGGDADYNDIIVQAQLTVV